MIPKRGHVQFIGDISEEVQENPRRSELDQELVRELTLYIDNNAELYRTLYLPIISNLQRKIQRGIYDRNKAIVAFKYLADEGAKRYCKEFCDRNTVWHEFFTSATRFAVAKELTPSKEFLTNQIKTEENYVVREHECKLCNHGFHARECHCGCTEYVESFVDMPVADNPVEDVLRRAQEYQRQNATLVMNALDRLTTDEILVQLKEFNTVMLRLMAKELRIPTNITRSDLIHRIHMIRYANPRGYESLRGDAGQDLTSKNPKYHACRECGRMAAKGTDEMCQLCNVREILK